MDDPDEDIRVYRRHLDGLYSTDPFVFMDNCHSTDHSRKWGWLIVSHLWGGIAWRLVYISPPELTFDKSSVKDAEWLQKLPLEIRLQIYDETMLLDGYYEKTTFLILWKAAEEEEYDSELETDVDVNRSFQFHPCVFALASDFTEAVLLFFRKATIGIRDEKDWKAIQVFLDILPEDRRYNALHHIEINPDAIFPPPTREPGNKECIYPDLLKKCVMLTSLYISAKWPSINIPFDSADEDEKYALMERMCEESGFGQILQAKNLKRLWIRCYMPYADHPYYRVIHPIPHILRTFVAWLEAEFREKNGQEVDVHIMVFHYDKR
ncbi:hypothetical protein P280DRAFT_471849 [Massarina eburnea CBS 473.64]|uniref:Uncharacterized protein n=1 Tax=Massarina eburnea CBS 473.64 TaxID=1395130 RepID=A0A6A6RRB8_9PLEO|nr:hypothetical protein P280DRAFT_471849 [Massarina eburnea CBS 473.64]